MAVVSNKCYGGGRSEHFTLTLYLSAGSVNKQNRTGTAQVYAVLSADSGYAFWGYSGVNLQLKINDTVVGNEEITKCGGSGTDYGPWTTSTFSKTLNYDSDGNLSCTASAVLLYTGSGNAPHQGNCDLSLNFANIGPSSITPSLTILNATINDSKLSSAIAGISSFKINYSTTNTQSVSAYYETNSVSQTLSPGESSVNTGIVPASDSDYTIKVYLTPVSSTNTLGETKIYSFPIKGYKPPSTNSSTYTTRCDSDGNTSAQGTYGKLHLTWDVTAISGNALNATPTVKLNGSTITAKSGSISDGYFDYVFALATTTQGNLTVTLTDKISSNTITSLFVSKANMPISFFDDGTDIGVSFGEMATKGGYNFFTNNGQWPVTIDGQPISASGGRQIFINTSATKPSDMKDGDILIVYEA